MIEIDFTRTLGDFTLSPTFTAPAGVTALFGPSGAGKTSVARAVAGLLKPDTGRITVGGRELFGPSINLPARKRRVGYVFQDARLFPHMAVLANLRYGGTRDEADVIEMLGLRPLLDRYPADLSGGERQRVALGRALMSGAELLILDEPLSALDAPRKAEILPWLERLRDVARVPILYISHDVSEVARLATTMVLMENGRVTRAGPTMEVLGDPDAVPLVGVRDAGALLFATVLAYDEADGLTTLTIDAGQLILPGRLGAPGDRVRLRVPAQDVILALERPQGLSALNILPVTITALTTGRGPGVAVGLAAGRDRLLARVTRRSADAMKLTQGQELFAVLKATAIATYDIGT
ncbi:molybdenum ABC transporter ATP-binding protein [Pelagovum pacificum]|uniref:Molybdenum ABC transporter ATP-binding protein n=1 Tax=Pelagovum pacificum TaxID=2588711 RepID=A0A5C5G840_9RHOB|nr:molybdenum ABC transporter ATP-binding protein [Pelagovum pacificum]QQA41577.1 molybdenum ABC transporter ATP-binding protein [Pelagovum pacificum]TNY30856.1 molybdenum ABC transporter ATP-binding protein [Pelagovum pacificum]